MHFLDLALLACHTLSEQITINSDKLSSAQGNKQVSTTPLVSICIPSFNHANFVGHAIQSVFQQDYHNIELIIIDDGSSDRSVEVIEKKIKEVSSRFVRFNFVARSNMGLSYTLNQALKWSEGKYFSMLSSDDILLPHKTKILVNYLENHGTVGGVFAGYDQIDEDGRFMRRMVPCSGQWSFLDVLNKRCQLYAPTMLLRMEHIRSVGGYWEDIALEDRAMSLKLSYAGHTLATISEVVARYRWHLNNNIKQTEKMASQRIAILKKFPHSAEIEKAKARVYFSAARELGKDNKQSAKHYFSLGVKAHAFSLLSKPAFRAAKRIMFY